MRIEKEYVHPIIVKEMIHLESNVTATSIDLIIGGPENSIPEITNFDNQTEISEDFDFNL